MGPGMKCSCSVPHGHLIFQSRINLGLLLKKEIDSIKLEALLFDRWAEKAVGSEVYSRFLEIASYLTMIGGQVCFSAHFPSFAPQLTLAASQGGKAHGKLGKTGYAFFF